GNCRMARFVEDSCADGVPGIRQRQDTRSCMHFSKLLGFLSSRSHVHRNPSEVKSLNRSGIRDYELSSVVETAKLESDSVFLLVQAFCASMQNLQNSVVKLL